MDDLVFLILLATLMKDYSDSIDLAIINEWRRGGLLQQKKKTSQDDASHGFMDIHMAAGFDWAELKLLCYSSTCGVWWL